MRLIEFALNEIEQNQQYATKKQLADLAEYMQDKIGGSFVAKAATKGKPIPHIRVHNATREEIDAIAQNIQLISQRPDEKQLDLSTQFKKNIFGFVDRLNTLYSFVISTKGTGAGVAKKSLTPAGLGIGGEKLSRDDLISRVRDALETKVRDEGMRKILDHLVTMAENRGGNLTPAEMASIEEARNVISSDFGEILAPIYLMGDKDTASFPSGNNPIVDVTISSKKGDIAYAVKSVSGSGNSFAAISDLMDRYDASIEDGSPEQAKYEVIKLYKKGQPGSVKDKIIAGSIKAETAESKEAAIRLGPFTDFTSLVANISAKLVTRGPVAAPPVATPAPLAPRSQNLPPPVAAPSPAPTAPVTPPVFEDAAGVIPYGDFLKLVYPISIAGGWGQPYGLPADYKFYMSGTGSAPADKQAGKKSYDRNPAEAAADIVVYILGQGLLQQATKGQDAEVYSKMMTDIVNKANVHLGKIDIGDDGALKVKTAPFSGIKFRFDYHASSHTPGRNSPGFIMVKS